MPTTRSLSIYLLFCAFVLAVVACNLTDTPEPIVVTATLPGEGVVVVTATFETTHTPEPLPTPYLPPQDAITNGQRAYFNGDFELAVANYQAVLNQDVVSNELRASAYYGLGKALLREGLFEQAVFAFNEFIEQYKDDARLPQVYFMRGEAHLGIAAWEVAIADFRRYLELRPGIIDSYAYERIGDAYLALGLPDQAFENYLAAANAVRSVAPLFALRERIAATYINQGRYDLAVQQYDAILTQARNNGYRASIELQAAQSEIAGGLINRGYARLQAMITLYPETPAAYQAMIALLNAGYPVDSWLRARISFAAEDYADAVDAVNAYTSQAAVIPAEALMLLGKAYRGVGNFEAAYSTFQTVITQYTNDPAFGEAWLEQGRTLFQSGDSISAVNHYTRLATDYPTSAQAPEALWRAGYLYSTSLNDSERALATFDILGNTYAGNQWAQEGLLLGASLALNAGQTARAQRFYTQLANTGSGENKALAFLWLGRLYRDQGQSDLAQQSFLGASQADPGGYYSLRAADILAGKEPFSPPPAYRFEFDEGAALAEAEQWLRATYGIQQEGLLYPLSAALDSDPHMVRGRELWELAAYDDARLEFDTLREQVEGDPLATYQLAHYFAQIGHYRASIEAAAILIENAQVSTFDAPSYIARLRYPVYYLDLVLPNAERYDLDPLLVFSVIRQESLFQSFATSSAAAQGLMQIIPDTGQWVATQLSWPNYQNSDVYRPFINVQFGTFYLSWVLDFVGGHPYAALAGYNGGPGNAQTWLNLSGADIDRFVQTVTFDETRRYVTRIYEQYDIYRYLYGLE